MGKEQAPGLWVGLAEAVGAVRAELEVARAQAEGSDLRFEVGPIELELAVDILRERAASAGVNVRVLSLGGSATAGRTDSHRLRITLHPRDGASGDGDGDGRPVSIADDMPELPPR